MNDKRPVNLDLSTLKFPVMAITSILHRLSGLAIFFALPLLLYLLDNSLNSSKGFADVVALIDNSLIKIILWGVLVAFAYHLLAGIRHMIMDLGVGESLAMGKRTASIVIIAATIAAILLGVWIW